VTVLNDSAGALSRQVDGPLERPPQLPDLKALSKLRGNARYRYKTRTRRALYPAYKASIEVKQFSKKTFAFLLFMIALLRIMSLLRMTKSLSLMLLSLVRVISDLLRNRLRYAAYRFIDDLV
jgi:hypothetical protein